MITVKVGNRKKKILRQWERDALLVVAFGLLGALWITGTLGSWLQL